ncbi:hypothetical protein B0H16DRAFT_1455134 [Mycena metata]|uniref:Uncharacterized protein n=1 Tax=Mycena metata TaxID=1033252 RepID=A0AAD7JFT8_9AGAR|nr:hypothetical protein B0H16DRAFT_1455134 [Mycena metata]
MPNIPDADVDATIAELEVLEARGVDVTPTLCRLHNLRNHALLSGEPLFHAGPVGLMSPDGTRGIFKTSSLWISLARTLEYSRASTLPLQQKKLSKGLTGQDCKAGLADTGGVLHPCLSPALNLAPSSLSSISSCRILLLPPPSVTV